MAQKTVTIRELMDRWHCSRQRVHWLLEREGIALHESGYGNVKVVREADLKPYEKKRAIELTRQVENMQLSAKRKAAKAARARRVA